MTTTFLKPALLPISIACAVAALSSVLSAPAFAQVDPSKMVDTFEQVGGKFEGFRRSGAKGLCATAEFIGSADGRALSVSSAFS
ncbi:catalase family peroxidase, partial [Roseateles sp. GG27B]